MYPPDPNQPPPDGIAAILAAILAQHPYGGGGGETDQSAWLPFLQPQGQYDSAPTSQQPPPFHPGAQLQDGPVGENAQLGWGTAPEMQYPQQPSHPQPHRAGYATAAHQRPQSPWDLPSKVAHAASGRGASGGFRHRRMTPSAWRQVGHPY